MAFYTDLNWSKEQGNWIIPKLQECFPSGTTITSGTISQDIAGADLICNLPDGTTKNIDYKVIRKDCQNFTDYTSGQPQRTLPTELYSNGPGTSGWGIAGQNKNTDWILWAWADTQRISELYDYRQITDSFTANSGCLFDNYYCSRDTIYVNEDYYKDCKVTICPIQD